jgi:hypothetical protein
MIDGSCEAAEQDHHHRGGRCGTADRSPQLTSVEGNMLTRYAEAYRFYRYRRALNFGAALDRLVRPLNDTLDYTGIITNRRKYVLLFFLREMAERKRSFW